MPLIRRFQCPAPTAEAPTARRRIPFSGKLSLEEAIRRGIAYNLGAVGMTQALRQVHGQAKSARSGLLPNVSADVADTEETFNLRIHRLQLQFSGVLAP